MSSLADAEPFAVSAIKQAGEQLGISPAAEPELDYSEMFNMVRGWRTTGRLYDVCVQFPRVSRNTGRKGLGIMHKTGLVFFPAFDWAISRPTPNGRSGCCIPRTSSSKKASWTSPK